MAELDDGPSAPPLSFARYLVLGVKRENLTNGRAGGVGRVASRRAGRHDEMAMASGRWC